MYIFLLFYYVFVIIVVFYTRALYYYIFPIRQRAAKHQLLVEGVNPRKRSAAIVSEEAKRRQKLRAGGVVGAGAEAAS
jgi:hypothetical protein